MEKDRNLMIAWKLCDLLRDYLEKKQAYYKAVREDDETENWYLRLMDAGTELARFIENNYIVFVRLLCGEEEIVSDELISRTESWNEEKSKRKSELEKIKLLQLVLKKVNINELITEENR